ncbi:MAG TPA: FAD:protein FMN transferase [Verrucomicrobiae bacterium]|nr:FAD:protein FMN transferase [Verrucomicrobiae bacterium]
MNRVLVPQINTPPAPRRNALPVELRGETMGTTWSVRAFAPPGFNTPRFQADIEALFADIIAQMSPWAPNSLINHFNNLPTGAWLALPAHFNAVLDGALQIAEQSNGAFDPTLGALVDLWGFGATPPAHLPPTDHELNTAHAHVGWQKLTRDGARLRQPGGLRLDLNGVAKGYTVDQVIALAKNASLPACLVEIGGELSGYGVKPDGQPWWVELEQPPGANFERTIAALYNLAIATSGDYRRTAQVGDRIISHTLSPTSGQPIDNNVASVAVLHPSCMYADAYASVLTVLGAEKAIAFANTIKLPTLIAVRTESAIVEHVSEAAAAMLG